MNKLNYIGEYFNENKTKIIITKDFVNIVNYISINDFSSKKIMISCFDICLIIYGYNLTINKMSDGELLIFGNFQNIVFN